ncbi:beta-n-acetyltransferase [Sporothrix schenckii 1099-18]|uniref:Beta-n-acetyltransferase n=1 Tax=Sporothrix schenckii 1099-18 TaxID=1397361 RepID=A0A0F2M6S9_SPOSC|nr:beta-n-acetyltransferase [Sporothrix schenckii 1099-18]KJR84789.1 beta-n-acetyltransferase [Sporothrix schenckii 1099-18]
MESPELRDISRRRGAVLVQDLQECLPLTTNLGEGDLLYLLTPAAVPIELPAPGAPAEDPFEPLGKALAEYHPWVRHIPYVARDGITQYHANHLTLAKAVIFVITGPPHGGQPSQVALSQIVRSIAPDRPHIVLVCCSLNILGPSDGFFPTLIEAQDYSIGRLECAADIIFLPRGTRRPGPMLLMESPQPRWLVEEWDILKDAPATHDLWCKCVPQRFRIDIAGLQRLLNRPGYAKHFVVRDPQTREVLGFCATYTAFIDQNDSTWVGCIAALLVQPSHRGRGVGTALHYHALRKLAEHRVTRLQLGSTFPRLLFGLPFEMESEDWFRRRGWRIDDSDLPGSGQEACDWVLDFSDWRAAGLSDGGFTFRRCQINEFDRVLEFVARESARKDNVGWYDQYYQLAGTTDIHDILLVLEGPQIVATALSYVPRNGSRVAEDLPWARTVSDLVGGVACICITDDFLSAAHTRDSVIIRLMNYCVQVLESQGMEKMFLDAVRGGAEGFQAIGRPPRNTVPRRSLHR